MLTFCIVAELVVWRAEVAVCKGAEAVVEAVTPPLTVVAPVVELVGRTPLVTLGHAVAHQATCSHTTKKR